MDFSGISMDQDPPTFLSFDSSDKWTDHVKWQGSQTACPALNQLIKSTVNETAAQDTPRISGWQRVSSYNQLSNLHSNGNHDITGNSSFLSSHSLPFSSKPTSSSRPHPRARPSEARAHPSPDITNLDLPIPLFNKTNSTQFLDILKGVSARLDENAGVRPRKESNPGNHSYSSSRAKKRTRGVSLGGASELQVGRATRGIVKKGRVDELRTTGTSIWNEGKGKGREVERSDSEVRERGLQCHSSLPDISSRSDLKRSLSSKDMCFTDIEDDSMDLEQPSRSAVPSSSSNPNTPFNRTLSQKKMPPPPFSSNSFVHEQFQPAVDLPRQQSNPPSISTPLTVDEPQTSYLPLQQPSIHHSIKPRKPDLMPKLHPLLHHRPATTTGVSSSSSAAQAQPQLASIPSSKDVKPAPSSFTPMLSSTPSSRPPPLGMRRNHTFPSRTVQQESSSCGSQLPRHQKVFKPPLLGLSQPQTQTKTQMQALPQVKTNPNVTDVVVVKSGRTIPTNRTESSAREASSSSSSIVLETTTTNTSTTILRSSSSFSNSSTTSCQSTPPPPPNTASPVSSSSHPCSPNDFFNPKKNSDPAQPQVLSVEAIIPEPLDGDGDSSFGDMSFDMDALEETMKMYD